MRTHASRERDNVRVGPLSIGSLEDERERERKRRVRRVKGGGRKRMSGRFSLDSHSSFNHLDSTSHSQGFFLPDSVRLLGQCADVALSMECSPKPCSSQEHTTNSRL